MKDNRERQERHVRRLMWNTTFPFSQMELGIGEMQSRDNIEVDPRVRRSTHSEAQGVDPHHEIFSSSIKGVDPLQNGDPHSY